MRASTRASWIVLAVALVLLSPIMDMVSGMDRDKPIALILLELYRGVLDWLALWSAAACLLIVLLCDGGPRGSSPS